MQLGYRGRNAVFITPLAAYPSNDNFLMRNCKMLTQKQLKKLLNYNPDTGIFTWVAVTSNRIKIGRPAGSLRVDGYMQISIKRKRYFAHRLAFLYMYGYLPSRQVDHKNHMRTDNRINNLNEVTHQENGKNVSRHIDNTSGVTGINWNGRKWHARIRADGENKNLGHFDDKFEAICVRLSANNKYGFHENHGR